MASYFFTAQSVTNFSPCSYPRNTRRPLVLKYRPPSRTVTVAVASGVPRLRYRRGLQGVDFSLGPPALLTTLREARRFGHITRVALGSRDQTPPPYLTMWWNGAVTGNNLQ